MYDLIYNGPIISLDDSTSVYNWMYIKDGKICDIGMYEGYKRYLKKSQKVLDLEGKTVLPGFIDSHVYMIQTGLNMMAVDLSAATTIDEVFEMLIKCKNDTPKGKLIRGVKFDELNIREKRYPTRKELDLLFPDHPVWINRIELHTSVVNSYALAQLRVPFNLPGVLRDDEGMTGIIVDRANAFVRKHYYSQMTNVMREEALGRAVEKSLENGITTVNAIEAGFAFSDMDGDFLIDKIEDLPLDIVLFYQTLDLDKIVEMGLPRVGCIFLDGSIGSRTASISEAYLDDPSNYGSLYYSRKV